MKQAIKKKTSITNSKPSIDDIKAKLGLNGKGEGDLTFSNADKPMDFIPMGEAFSNAIKLPGFPMGYMSIITGWSNTGKSTLVNKLISSCVNNGILPVIYDTENNFDFQYAIDCGLKATPIYQEVEYEVIDEETGEITIETENQIVEWKGDFIHYNSRKLAEAFGDIDHAQGKRVTKKRTQAVIEDIAYSINEILDLQEEGAIQQPVCFIWDSVGSIQSYKSYTSKVGNNMFDANSLSVAFTNILNSRIPSSRNINAPYSNTFVCVNKIWNDSMNSMGGVPSIELKGGKSFFYAARLIIHLGGVSKASIKKLNATAKGATYNYGIISKMKVNKNQLPTPYNITYEGEIACVHCGIWIPTEIENYKKTYSKHLLKKIEELSGGKVTNIKENEMSFEEYEGED